MPSHAQAASRAPRPSDSAPPAPVRLRRNLRCCRRHPAIDRAVGDDSHQSLLPAARLSGATVETYRQVLETCRQHCCELRLTPAYDIVNTTAYIPQDVLALDVVGNKSLFASRQGLLEFAQVCYVARPTEVIRKQLQALERLLARSTELCEQAPHVVAAIR